MKILYILRQINCEMAQGPAKLVKNQGPKKITSIRRARFLHHILSTFTCTYIFNFKIRIQNWPPKKSWTFFLDQHFQGRGVFCWSHYVKLGSKLSLLSNFYAHKKLHTQVSDCWSPAVAINKKSINLISNRKYRKFSSFHSEKKNEQDWILIHSQAGSWEI